MRKAIKALEAAPAKQATKTPVAFASNDAVNKIVVPSAKAGTGLSTQTENLFKAGFSIIISLVPVLD